MEQRWVVGIPFNFLLVICYMHMIHGECECVCLMFPFSVSTSKYLPLTPFWSGATMLHLSSLLHTSFCFILPSLLSCLLSILISPPISSPLFSTLLFCFLHLFFLLISSPYFLSLFPHFPLLDGWRGSIRMEGQSVQPTTTPQSRSL